MIEFKNYSFSYAGSEEKVLKDINLTIPENEITIVCGRSGSGKTTLIRSLKTEIAPVGTQSGEMRSLCSKDVAIVFQNPDTQLVFGEVLHNLVFHMENLAIDNRLMRNRLAQTVNFFGIEHLLHKRTDTLSGGQKQLVALCSALMTYPKLLLLDEPISSLDPIAAQRFLDILRRVNEEFSVTILMSEHRLDDCIKIAHNLIMLEDGAIVEAGAKVEVMQNIAGVESLNAFIPKKVDEGMLNREQTGNSEKIITVKNLVFSYPNEADTVLKRLSVDFFRGEFVCIFGGNGSGKSTFLKILAGIQKSTSGKVKNMAKVLAYMPQNVSTYFVHDTVEEEILFDGCDMDYYAHLMDRLKLNATRDRHPFDLSGGEMKMVILASILLKKPEVILLDEPTRGVDPYMKEMFANVLKESGATVIMATHDKGFAYSYADRCITLFDGDVF